MKLYERAVIPQDDPLWIRERIGCCTGTRIGAAMNYLKNGRSSSDRMSAIVEVAGELLSGRAAEHYQTRAMLDGIERQPLCKAAYDEKFKTETVEGGFIRHATIERCGASTDYHVGHEGILECKCPTLPTFVKYVQADAVPEEYIPQVTLQLACSGRHWVDLAVYYPGLPLFVRRFRATEEQIREVEIAAVRFNEEVEELYQTLRTRLEMPA